MGIFLFNCSEQFLYGVFEHICCRGRRGRDRMVVGFITTYAISAYHY